MKRLLRSIDGYDVAAVAGVGLLVAGVALWSIPVGLITGGAVLILFAVGGAKWGSSNRS